MLTGVLFPDQGQVRINGLNPQENRKAVNKQIGVLFGQKSHLDWNLPVQESFILHAKIYDVPDKVFKERLAVLIELLDLADIMKQPIRNLSLGQRVRCEFAAIFIHQPAVVFGRTNHRLGCQRQGDHSLLHPLYESRIPDHLLITSHDMKDIESLCERIFIIDKGKKVYDGSLTVLKERFSTVKTILFSTENQLKKICNWRAGNLFVKMIFTLKSTTKARSGPAPR